MGRPVALSAFRISSYRALTLFCTDAAQASAGTSVSAVCVEYVDGQLTSFSVGAKQLSCYKSTHPLSASP